MQSRNKGNIRRKAKNEDKTNKRKKRWVTQWNIVLIYLASLLGCHKKNHTAIVSAFKKLLYIYNVFSCDKYMIIPTIIYVRIKYCFTLFLIYIWCMQCITCLPHSVPKGNYSVQYTHINMYCLQKKKKVYWNNIRYNIMGFSENDMLRSRYLFYLFFIIKKKI